MFPSRQTYSGWNTAPADGGVSEMKLTPGMILSGLMLSVLYSVNVTTAGAAVRTRSLPIKRVSLIGDNGKYIHSIKGVDLITKALIFEQTPVGALLVPASGFAIANYTALEAHVPIFFRQPHADNGDKTSLPTYAYQNLTLRVEWGSVTDLLTGTPVGPITFTANGQTVTQIGAAGLGLDAMRGAAIARILKLSVDRYVEVTQGAVAATDLELKIGNTSDVRAMLLTSELTSTGEPTDTIVNSLRLTENNSVNVYASVPWKTLKAENARVFGLTMPTGVALIDFAEDRDIDNIYPASLKDAVSMFFNTAAVAGTIRAHLMTIERSPVAA